MSGDLTAEQRLLCIKEEMGRVQQCAEVIAGHVLALEEMGIDLPSMRQTAGTLAQIALGWAVPR